MKTPFNLGLRRTKVHQHGSQYVSPNVFALTRCRTNRHVELPIQSSSEVHSGCREPARHFAIAAVDLDTVPFDIDWDCSALEDLTLPLATGPPRCPTRCTLAVGSVRATSTTSSILRRFLRLFAAHLELNFSAALSINGQSGGGCPAASISAVGMQLYG